MSTRDKLLGLLDGPSGRTFSGTALGEKLGVSRTAIWKQIQVLKRIGMPIAGTRRDGYRLEGPCDPSLLHFHAAPGIVPHYYLTTVSTQGLAKAGAAAGLPEGHLWIAESQSKGRGRLDRSWESLYGGLWFSLLLRPKLAPARVTPLTLIAGLSLRQAVEQVSGVEARLKWPNDLLVSSRQSPFKKIAGILTEMSGQMERTDWLAMGIGLNVHNTLSDALSPLAATLYGITGKVWPRGLLLEAFLADFMPNYARFVKEGFMPFRETYWERYFAPKGRVRLHTASGLVTGTAVGVDAHGALIIESRRKIQSFSEGEIVL